MADNVQLNTMTDGDIVGADDISGVKYQRIKLIIGADGTNDGDVASGNPLPVTGTVTAELGTTDNAILDDIASKLGTIDADTSALSGTVSGTEVQVDIVGSLPAGTNAIGKLAANSGVDIGDVDVLSLPAVTIASSQTLATVTTVGTVTTLTGGGVAHDGTDSGNPIKIGTKCEATPSAQVVADADRSDVLSDMDGAVFVREGCTIGDALVEAVTNTNGTATALSVFTTGAGIRNVITDIIGYNSSETAGFVNITDGSGGTTLMTVPLPAGGGAVINLRTPIKSTANTALYYDVSGAISTIYLTFVGYRTKVS